MLIHLLLGLLATGQAAQAPSQVPAEITAKTFVAPGASGPAKGDGGADDTAALQGALDYAIAHKVPLRLEPGVYVISKTLDIEGPTPGPCGFKFYGTGMNRGGAVERGGVTIVLAKTATDQQAILRIGHADFRDMQISDIGLMSQVPGNATPYGILFAGGKFSHAMLDNVSVGAVDTAYGIVPSPGEGNGEAVDLTACQGNYVNCFYHNTAGQAYCHHMLNCMASIMNGGTCFKIGSGNLGFSLDVFGFMSTMIMGPKRNTYIENDGVSGTCNFLGGRSEHVDTLLAYLGGSYGDEGIFTIAGMQTTDYSGSYPFIDGTLNHAGAAQWTNSFENCRFDARTTHPEMMLGAQGGDLTRNVFSRCVFVGFGSVFPDGDAKKMGVVLHDCRADKGNDRKLYDIGG